MKWPFYNQSLIIYGKILLRFNVINNWDIELKEMNKDKVGLGAISLSKSLSSFPWICQSNFIYHTDKIKEGIAQGHARGRVLSIPDYSTTSKG